MSNREFTAQRTMLANAFATAGAELLEYMGVSSALAAIPNTEPQQYVVAGTLQMIAKALPGASQAAPAAPEQLPAIGRLLDEFSALPVLWGLNEPGALIRHSDVFKMLVNAGKTYLAAPSAAAPAAPKQASGSDGTAAIDASELHFNATRLRNVARLVGLESAVPQDDATLDGARGSILGLIAGKLRTAAATSGSELAADDPIRKSAILINGLWHVPVHVLAQQAGAPADSAQLAVGVETSAHGAIVVVHLKRGDQHTVLYSGKCPANTMSSGIIPLPAAMFAAPATAAQDERDAKDAARYRWIRARENNLDAITDGDTMLFGECLDLTIDTEIAAISQSKQGTAGQDGAA